jgi:hypothetical protein
MAENAKVLHALTMAMVHCPEVLLHVARAKDNTVIGLRIDYLHEAQAGLLTMLSAVHEAIVEAMVELPASSTVVAKLRAAGDSKS